MNRKMVIGVAICCLLSASAYSGDRKGTVELLPTAKGRTGPVGLEITLLRNKIKIGESLFVKTTLTNLAKDPMYVADWIYRGSDDLSEVWTNYICDAMDPPIEVRDSKGRRLKPSPYHDSYGSDSPFTQTVGSPEVDERLKKWKAEGFSEAQINERLQKEELQREGAKRDAKYPVVVLKQAQSVDTVPWCAAGRRAERTPTAVTCPGNGFVELATYTFERPGRYRIRAVRDYRLSKDQLKWATPWNVRVATDWISFEVTR